MLQTDPVPLCIGLLEIVEFSQQTAGCVKDEKKYVDWISRHRSPCLLEL